MTWIKKIKLFLYYRMQVRKETPHASTLKKRHQWSLCKTRLTCTYSSEYSGHGVDGGEGLFNKDVFSGTGVANVFPVILLEGPPVGQQRRSLVHEMTIVFLNQDR